MEDDGYRDRFLAEIAPLREEVRDLRDEVIQLRETLGERALSITELSRLSGKSTNTLYRRIEDGSLPVASTCPIRVLYSEYRRALEEGRLR
jgi:AraC-like DNA-binding protein